MKIVVEIECNVSLSVEQLEDILSEHCKITDRTEEFAAAQAFASAAERYLPDKRRFFDSSELMKALERWRGVAK